MKYTVSYTTLSVENQQKVVEVQSKMAMLDKLDADLQTQRATLENELTEKKGAIIMERNSLINELRILRGVTLEETP